VVIAAITSCTNTSNPAVMLGAGLLARNAVAKGLKAAPWVKTSLGPGLAGRHRLPAQGRPAGRPGATRLLRGRLRLHHLHRQLRAAAAEVSKGIAENDLVVASVLSGNRNFEGRVHPK
jgi:aconitate hydratase